MAKATTKAGKSSGGRMVPIPGKGVGNNRDCSDPVMMKWPSRAAAQRSLSLSPSVVAFIGSMRAVRATWAVSVGAKNRSIVAPGITGSPMDR